MLCPSFEILALYESDQLDADTWAEVDEHLQLPCGSCRERLAWYRKEHAALNNPLPKGPERLREKAHELFLNRMPGVAKVPPIIFTSLIFDSAVIADRPEARSLGVMSETSRRFLFRADMSNIIKPDQALDKAGTQCGFDIDIEIVREKKSFNFTLRGQILFEQLSQAKLTNIQVSLYKDSQLLKEIATNQHGEFVFTAIAEGNYTIQVKLAACLAVANIPVTLPQAN